MASPSVGVARSARVSGRLYLHFWLGTAAFLALFWAPFSNTARAWWTNPDAGHGLLLAPLAIILAWRRGVSADARPQPILGLLVISSAVMLRYLSALAAEVFTMRLSMLGAAVGLVIYAWGIRQLLRWWLPATLLLLSMPLPEILLSSLALPLQFQASRMGAALLRFRHVPVLLAGNVIHLAGGHQLFVTEACSGLRSLSALIALGLLMGGVWLRTVPGRVSIMLLAVPIAMVLNAVRVFATGFSVHYVDPALGEGVMHFTQGWVMFGAAFAVLSATCWVVSTVERRFMPAPMLPVEVTP